MCSNNLDRLFKVIAIKWELRVVKFLMSYICLCAGNDWNTKNIIYFTPAPQNICFIIDMKVVQFRWLL